MRLHLLLPKVEPEKWEEPTRCVYPGCAGKRFRLHQPVKKPLRETIYQEVQVYRYQCLKCQRTFRVYPQGTSGAQTSQRVKGLAVLLSLLGLSYGAVSLTLEALGVQMARSSVYALVQEAASHVPDLKRDRVCEGVKTPALGGDLTTVKCKGKWLPLGIAVDPLTGLVLSVDTLSAEDTQTLRDWIEPIAHSVGAQVLVTDDADGFKTVADEIGTQHQVCKSHVKRNTEALIER
jgi:transposase-like protein